MDDENVEITIILSNFYCQHGNTYCQIRRHAVCYRHRQIRLAPNLIVDVGILVQIYKQTFVPVFGQVQLSIKFHIK